jgi:hypothetical protein
MNELEKAAIKHVKVAVDIAELRVLEGWSCLAVNVGDNDGWGRLFMELGRLAAVDEENTGVCRWLVPLQGFKVDDFGKGLIVYWPHLKPE